MPAIDTPSAGLMDRREAIKWMLTAAAAVGFLRTRAPGAGLPPMGPIPHGYGTDPDLLKVYAAGDVWPLTFDAAQRRTAAALCDTILPADSGGPAASAVRVHEFIDEWISAPYPGHADDRKIVIEGLAWLDAESRRRFGNGFAALIVRQKQAICDDIRHEPEARPEFKAAARFFTLFRDLSAGGYYTTPEGMRDIGYVGNVALGRYDGPPPEVLQRLGLG